MSKPVLIINELDKWEELNEPCQFCVFIEEHTDFTPAKYHIYNTSNGEELLLCEKCKKIAEDYNKQYEATVGALDDLLDDLEKME